MNLSRDKSKTQAFGDVLDAAIGSADVVGKEGRGCIQFHLGPGSSLHFVSSIGRSSSETV